MVTKLKPADDPEHNTFKAGDTFIVRTHCTLTEADLAAPCAQIVFNGIPNDWQKPTVNWLFVNQQLVGETTGKKSSELYFKDCRKSLRVGDNVIAWGIKLGTAKNFGTFEHGINLKASVDLINNPTPPAWSRSVFNGLAQVLVQSTREAGQIQLTASGDGLKPATAAIKTTPSTPQSRVYEIRASSNKIGTFSSL